MGFRTLWIAVLILCFKQGQFQRIFPENEISYVGGSVTFRCTVTSGTATNITWTLNGTENFDSSNVIVDFSSTVGLIRLDNLSSTFNNTRIQCNVHRSSGSIILSDMSLLIVLQGTPLMVRNLNLTRQDYSISLVWTAPMPLNISDLDSNVTYCVDVVNITTPIRSLRSECGINVTEYTYQLPPGAGCGNGGIRFEVVPVNVVGRGEADREIFNPKEVSKVVESLRISASPITYNLRMSAPICYGTLMLVDLDIGTPIPGINFHIGAVNITFTAEGLEENRRYNVTVTTFNVVDSDISVVEISTHGISTAILSDNVIGTVSYHTHSNSIGALLTFLLVSDVGSIDFNRSTYLALSRNASDPFQLPDLYPGAYMLLAFDIEEDGTLHNGEGYAAFNQSFESQVRESSPAIDSCRITSDVRLIKIECTFLDSSMATGFQVTAQLSNTSGVSKLYANHTVDRQASSTIHVNDDSMYLVAVFAIRQERGIADASVEYMEQLMIPEAPTSPAPPTSTNDAVAAVVLIIPLSIIITAVMIGLLLKIRRRQKRKRYSVAFTKIRGELETFVLFDGKHAFKIGDDPVNGDDHNVTVGEEVIQEALEDDKPKFSQDIFFNDHTPWPRLSELCKEVNFIIKTGNEKEYLTAVTTMEHIAFGTNGVVIGQFANDKVALISGRVFGDVSIDNFPNAKYVIEVGTCCAFDSKKYKLGDVLVSETIRIHTLNQRRNVMSFLKLLFCENPVVVKRFRVCRNSQRVSEIYVGKYVTQFEEINNSDARQKFRKEFPEIIGGDLHGDCLQCMKKKGSIEGVIMIKGVADYGGGDKLKEWEHTATIAALKYIETKLLQPQGSDAAVEIVLVLFVIVATIVVFVVVWMLKFMRKPKEYRLAYSNLSGDLKTFVLYEGQHALKMDNCDDAKRSADLEDEVKEEAEVQGTADGKPRYGQHLPWLKLSEFHEGIQWIIETVSEKEYLAAVTVLENIVFGKTGYMIGTFEDPVE